MRDLWRRAARQLAIALLVSGVGFIGSASATLLDRGPNLVYDDVLDITWVRNAHLCVALSNCVSPNNTLVQGGMTWANANTWASNLVYQGYDDWRLPFASVAAGSGPTVVVHLCQGTGGPDEVACRDNEMGYMFHYNLAGNPSLNRTGDQTGVGGELLTNIQFLHWSATSHGDPVFAWDFLFAGGILSDGGVTTPLAAWAVRFGDVVAAAPEPGSLALIGLGALALVLSLHQRARRI